MSTQPITVFPEITLDERVVEALIRSASPTSGTDRMYVEDAKQALREQTQSAPGPEQLTLFDGVNEDGTPVCYTQGTLFDADEYL